ncbi:MULTISPECIES: sensor histidine kinase [Streptomyces]|uniref:sensor histidine kinase n=1 Tax=Streptomyces TaxID=1883 RepID=UPI002248ADE3|nr:sensor histidine kinase [Streptomyces sp. JHD 1]MCX2968837.1 CHASE3 domain-containing protein [Streptomyces sp. JHD 1]
MSTMSRPPGPRLTVRGWLHLVVAVILLFVVGCAVGGAALLARGAAHTDDLVERVQPARTDAYRLQKALLDQETGLRGYVIGRDEAWLEPYTAGVSDEADALRRLRPALAGDDTLAGDLAAVERLAGQWRREHAEPMIDQVGAGEVYTESDPEMRASKQAFDRLRDAFDVQEEHLLQARLDAQAEMEAADTTHTWLLAGMLVAFVAVAVALSFLLHLAVLRPLRALRVSVQHVAGGEVARRIPASGPADLRAVAESVEAMREHIVAELDAARGREALLQRQAEELDRHTTELERSNAELEQFAYVASHDLQEPLRKVASFCQLLEKRYGGELDERGKQYIDFAVDGAKRMQGLINDLLTFSRVGRLHDAREHVPLGDALDRALANLGSAVEESGAAVERPERLPAITGDPNLLTMLWQNLLGNAVKFRHPERPPRVRVTVEACEGGVGPGADAGPGWLLCVTDNGIGVPAEFAQKVFVIFQRLHGRDAYAGTGIGLALCKKIVEHHGGTIWLDTAHTGGTRVCFTLPAPPGTGPAALTDADAADGAATDAGADAGTGAAPAGGAAAPAGARTEAVASDGTPAASATEAGEPSPSPGATT